MDETDALIDAARARLIELGLDVSLRRESAPHVRADATVALRLGGSRQRFAVHARSAVRLRDVLEARDSAGPVLVVARWISAKVGAQLREIGIAYVDSVGNASVRFGTVLIEVSGRKRPAVGGFEARSARTSTGGEGSARTSTGGEGSARTSTGGRASTSGVSVVEVRGAPATSLETTRARTGRLLTPANRRVIAALLDDPGLETATLRELAEAAGVSLGQAHKSVTLLGAAGYHREHLDEAQRAALRGVLDAVQAVGG